jgi:hypothetical protein
MVRLISLMTVIVGTLALHSCAVGNEDTFKTTGTIAFRSDVLPDFQGFYFIIGDDGSEYCPINLEVEFQQKGMRIRFEARELPNTRPVDGWGNGPVIELVHIQKLPA